MPIPSKQPGLTVTFFWRIGGSWPAGEILSLTSCPFILVDPACNRVVAFEKTCQVDRLPHLIRRSLSDTAFSTGYDRNGVNNYGISCLHIDQNENDIASCSGVMWTATVSASLGTHEPYHVEMLFPLHPHRHDT